MMENALKPANRREDQCTQGSAAKLRFDCDENLEEVFSLAHTIQKRDSELSVHGSTEHNDCWQPPQWMYIQTLLAHTSSIDTDLSQCPCITDSMRAILLDWMMEVCAEFTLKRETFHLAVSYVDRALGQLKNLKKSRFQLLGLAAMVLAAKNEEICVPRLVDWSQSADNGYSLHEIKHMEKFLLKTLEWRINPVSSVNWVNCLMSTWDSFVEFHFSCVECNQPDHFKDLPKAERELYRKQFEKRFIVFKYPNKHAYRRFRETMQLLDLGMLDPRSMALCPLKLSCGLLYLMVSNYFYKTHYELLHFAGPDSRFPTEETDEELYENASILHKLFENFLRYSVGVDGLKEVYEAVVLFHPYLEQEFHYELPKICTVKAKSKIERHYHEFLAYQTYNPNTLNHIRTARHG